jgi:hypothetical protein
MKNTRETEDILQERAKIYGNYQLNIKARVAILNALEEQRSANGLDSFTAHDRQYFQDIVMKLVRAAISPDYIDSWSDLAGYAKLIEAIKLEKDNENNK